MSLIEKKSLLDKVLEAQRFFEIAMGKATNKFGKNKAGAAFTFEPKDLGILKLKKSDNGLVLIVIRDFVPANDSKLFRMAYDAFKKDCEEKDPRGQELLFVPVVAHDNWNGDCENFVVYLNPQPNELEVVGSLDDFDKDPFRFFIKNCIFKPVIENAPKDNSLKLEDEEKELEAFKKMNATKGSK